MQITLVLAISILLQFVAAILALRLIPATGRRKAWIAVSAAILLMAFRRCITLYQLASGKVDDPSDFAGQGVEWITLAISVFMLAGIYWIAPIFFSIRRSAEALRESEEKYRTLFEKSRDAVYVTDQSGRLIDVNESCLDLFGYPRQEMAGMDVRKLYVDFAARERLREELNRIGYLQDHEIRLRKKDGTEMDCLLTTTVRTAVDGTLLGYQGIVRDITARKQMELALQKSNEVLNAILAAAPVGIGLVRNHIFDWVNNTMYRLVGYEQNTLLKKNALMLYPDPSEYERVDEQLHAGLDESCSDVYVDTQWVRKDGTRFYCLLQACPLDPSDPSGAEIVAVMDVTERKQAEEALMESEIRYRTLFEAAHEAILLLDGNGICTDCNPAAERLFVRSKEEILGTAPFEFSPQKRPDDRDFLEGYGASIHSVLQGTPRRFEWLFRTRKDQILETEVSLSRVSVKEKVEILAVIRDISRQKEAQRQLLHEMEHLASVLDGSPLASCMINRHGDVILWNRACELMTRIRREDVLGRPLDLKPLFEGKDLPVLAEMLLKMDGKDILDRFGKRGVKLYEPCPEAIESKGFIVLDGKRKNLRIIAARVRDSSGKMTGVFQCVEDITGEEELRRQLLHAQKMEAVARLAGGVAHDFNNALMSITGYADLIRMQLDEDSPLTRMVEEISKAGERASSLTRHLLAFGRRQVFQPKILDLNVIISDLERMLRRLIGEDIDLITVLNPALDPVKIDPVQVEQIITNLVINARDAMPGGGRIVIETANVELDESFTFHHVDVHPGSYVVLAVSDTGIGMDAETLSHIFEPFFSTKEEGRGTGLGLSSVYGIVQQNQGHIWVYSEEGKGSVFKICLPRVVGATVGDRQIGETAGPVRGSETVLLVEDDGMVREIVSEILRSNGYTVLEAGHGDEALRMLESYKEPIHLLLTDVVMPGMSGLDLAARVMESRPHIKVIYMSGYTRMGIEQWDVMDHAGAAFLQKPFPGGALLHKVRDLLDGG